MAIIEIQNLSFTYPQESSAAIENINLSINEGEFIVVAGESGCGKTTLLKCLKREITPYGSLSGKIYYSGVQLKDLNARKSAADIGYVMQNPESQIVTDRVYSELAFGLESLGQDSATIKRRVAEMSGFFGINDWFFKSTLELSGGQKQLLSLASIMVMQPKVLILDEPTAQLDPIAASEFISALNKLNKELGLTIIMVEHRLEEVFPLCDRAIIMEGAKVIYFGKPHDAGGVLRRADNKMLLGMPAAVRMYAAIDGMGECPLSVKEGRNFLMQQLQNRNITFNPTEKFDNKSDSKTSLAECENIYGGTSKAECENINGETNKAESEGIDNKTEPIHYALKVKNLWHRYSKTGADILRGVDLKVLRGEIFSLVGGNGSGKTTLLKSVSGLIKSYRGKITVGEKNIKDYKNGELYKNNIALLPQNPQEVFLKNSVEGDYYEMNKVLMQSKEDYEKAIAKILKKLSIEHLKKKNPYDLSGGEQQKAALGKILLLQPKILLLDEPTKGIDAYSKSVLKDIILGLKSEGITIFIVTHDLEFAAEISDKVAMLFAGEVISCGTPADFFAGNSFYTTAADRISRGIIDNCVTVEEIGAKWKSMTI